MIKPNKSLQVEMKKFMASIEVYACYNEIGKHLQGLGNPKNRVRGLIEWAVANKLEQYCSDYKQLDK